MQKLTPRPERGKVFIVVALVAIVAVMILNPWISPGGSGIQGGESLSTIEKDKQGSIIKRSYKVEQGKTAWDWLSLLGVPITLAILGYALQRIQQQKAADDLELQSNKSAADAKLLSDKIEADAKLQRAKAEESEKEEVLQLYIDRLSELLIEKLSLAIATKEVKSEQEKHLVESAQAIVRARTLSVLQRFSDDPNRKESVIRFLIESFILDKLKIDLGGANLAGASLVAVSLEKIDLSLANLSGVNLFGSNLTEAVLIATNFTEARLIYTTLDGADLTSAKFAGAKLKNATLINADLYNVSWDEQTSWPPKENLAGAKNIPTDLKRKLGLA